MLLRIRSLPLTLLALFVTAPAAAQEGGPIDIDFGPSRIGGPGVTRSERAAHARSYEPEEMPTEDNIPPVGHKNRIKHIHILAKRNASGRMWKAACDHYDQIVREAGAEGLDEKEGGRKLAARSFFHCGESEAKLGHFAKSEALLKKSERYGVSDYRQAGVRRRMKREQYRDKMIKGDVDGAMAIFESYQTDQKDEDERIWMGEQFAALADRAYKDKDQAALERYIRYGQKVAPRNPQLRKLTEQIESEATIVQKAILAGLAGVFLIVLLTGLGRWRGRKKIEALAGGGSSFGRRKNKFIDDDDL